MNKDINVPEKGLCNNSVIECIARRKTLMKTVIKIIITFIQCRPLYGYIHCTSQYCQSKILL